MSKKLKIDSLRSEITSLEGLIESADTAGDFIGSLQLKSRFDCLMTELQALMTPTLDDNSASVAIFFGGKPVLGSKGISAEFAGEALDKFQALISKTFARAEQGQLGSRGKVPFKANSELMVTGLARGSFGFILDEMSNQVEIDRSPLNLIIDQAASIIENSAATDDTKFYEVATELDPRTLMALRDLFISLDSHKATMRVVEGTRDFIIDQHAVSRGRLRTEATSIDETNTELDGILIGFLPEHRKFEIKLSDGQIVFGSVTKEAVAQYQSAVSEQGNVMQSQCLAKVVIRKIKPINRPAKEVLKLTEFMQFQPA